MVVFLYECYIEILHVFSQVMPDLFITVRSCDDSLREFIFLQLALLVSIVKQVQKYGPIIEILHAGYKFAYIDN